MKEDIKIIILNKNGEIVSSNNQYESYTFDSQYNMVADAFSVTLVDNKQDIERGYGIQLLINNIVEFNGIIQCKERNVEKNDHGITLSGKDRAGILVEGYCHTFTDYNNTLPKTIIDDLIDQTNFYTKQKGTANESVDSTGFNDSGDVSNHNSTLLSDVNSNDTLSSTTDVTIYDTEFTALSAIKHFKISPGETVYDKINQLVVSQGYEILYQENGTLYVGNLNKKRYADSVVYSIVFREDGRGNNVLSSNLIDDESGRYSTISITSQSEDYQYSATKPSVNVEKIATDSTLGTVKYFAQNINDNEGSPEKIAVRIREDQRIAGYQLRYEVPGHVAENGHAWRVNRYVNIYDDINDIMENLVLYGRTFEFSRSTGTRTLLRLSHERSDQLTL